MTVELPKRFSSVQLVGTTPQLEPHSPRSRALGGVAMSPPMSRRAGVGGSEQWNRWGQAGRARGHVPVTPGWWHTPSNSSLPPQEGAPAPLLSVARRYLRSPGTYSSIPALFSALWAPTLCSSNAAQSWAQSPPHSNPVSGGTGARPGLVSAGKQPCPMLAELPTSISLYLTCRSRRFAILRRAQRRHYVLFYLEEKCKA